MLLQLRIPYASSLAGASFTLQLRVVDFLDVGGTASHKVTITGGKPAPQISLPGGPRQSFAISRGVKVQAAVVAESLCPGRRPVFSWVTDLPGVPPGYSSRELLVPGPLPGAVDGAKYFAEVAVKFDDSNATSIARVALTAVNSPLVARVAGSAGDISLASKVTLSAARSLDPDDPGNGLPFTFTWECIREDHPKPCFQVQHIALRMAEPTCSLCAGRLSAACTQAAA